MTFLKKFFRFDHIDDWFEDLLIPIKNLFDPRFFWMFIPAMWILSQDYNEWKALMQTIVFVYLLVAISHWVRKSILTRVDMAQFANKACEHPIAAALVYCATILYLMFLGFMPVYWIKP